MLENLEFACLYYIIINMRRIFVFILFAIVLLSGCKGTNEASVSDVSSHAAYEPEETAVEEETGLSDSGYFLYGRSFLPPLQQQVYDELSEKAGKYDFDADIPISPGIDDSDLASLISYFRYDHPEYYWAVPEIVLNEADGARSLRITADEKLPPELIRKRQEEIDAAAEQFLKDTGGDTFETVVAVHDRLVERVMRDPSFKRDSGNIYGALVGKEAICDGYAKAFQYLMAIKGIRCIYFQGEGSSGTPHAWNAVFIEDSWYYVDVTWDTLGSNRVLHTHLCITLEELLREREFDRAQYPEIVEADSDEYNYFNRKGCSVSADGDAGAVRELAEAFVNGLNGRTFSARESPQFLEVKVYATPERYSEIRDEFIRDPFLVLREMDRIAFEKKLPFEVVTEGSVNCNHKDLMQILILWPKVKKV